MTRHYFFTGFLMAIAAFLLPESASSQLQKIYLSPKGAGSAAQSDFVDSIHFIPLDAVEGISLDAWSNMTVTGDKFIIIDNSEQTIVFFSRSGRFLKKISYKKLGKGFYPSYHANNNQIVFFGTNNNYALTPKDRIDINLHWNEPRNKKYFKKYIIDLNDSLFALHKSAPLESDIADATHLYGDYYFSGEITTSDLYKDSIDYECKIYHNNAIVKKYFPYNHIKEPKFLFDEQSASINKTAMPNVQLITRPFCDTVYKLVNDSIFPYYQLVLPLENSLPPSFFTKPFKNKTERDNFSRNNGWMLHQLYGFYENPSFIFFAVGYLTNYETYLYKKATKATYKLKSIKPDSTQYNLSLLSEYGIVRDGDKIYKTQKAGDLIAFFEQHKGFTVPKELEAYFKTKPHNAAPVIVEFKLKSNP